MAGVFSFITSLTAKATCAQIISIVILTLGSTQAAPSSGYDLWTNPCSTHPVRHIRSTAETELKFFINTLNKDMLKKLRALYPKDLKKVTGNCPRLRRLIEPIEKAPNLTIAHQNSYKSMIEFAVFLEKLKEMRIETNSQFNFTERKDIYERTQHILRLTICEFNQTIMNESKTPIALFVKKAPSVNTRCLPKKADLSRVQMLDMQFFKKLKKFFKQAKKILQRKKMNSKSGRVKGGARKRTNS